MSVISLGLWMVVAQSPTLAVAADAAELVRQGIELRRHGQDAAALKAFEQAYQLDQSPRIVAQLGLAEQALGRWVPSFEHLRRALGATTDPWIVKNRSAIVHANERVAEHVGLLEITEAPTGAEIRLDGVRRGTLPLSEPLAVTLGAVIIEVSATGYLPAQRTTTIRARETTRESFDGALRPAPKAPVAAPPVAVVPPPREPVPLDRPAESVATPSTPAAITETASSSEPSRRWPLVLTAGGVAAAGLVFGLVEHLAWQKNASSFEDMAGCGADEPNRGTTGCRGLYDSGNRDKVLAFVGYGIAAAGAITATVLYLTSPAQRADGHQVACMMNPVATSLGCTLRF